MKPEQLALAAHVDQIVRNAGYVKGESDDHHRVEGNDHPRQSRQVEQSILMQSQR
jgi:hypothetical protein